MPVLPLRKRSETLYHHLATWLPIGPLFPINATSWTGFLLSILMVTPSLPATSLLAQDEPPDQAHEREELGVNVYTTPSIARIFQQLDELKPLSFEQLRRPSPQTLGRNRQESDLNFIQPGFFHKLEALLFGELIADGFLIVEAERKNLVESFGRVLFRQAQVLGVAERVTRHSASLTEAGRPGDWVAVHRELIATQADVEQAMTDLRDEKIAHLISLGGWLRGLEISADAISANFSPARANILVAPDLVDYFLGELKTLPPLLVHAPLFDRIRQGIAAIQAKLNQSSGQLTLSDVQAIRVEAAELNKIIRERRGRP